jgi:hypothetical protein
VAQSTKAAREWAFIQPSWWSVQSFFSSEIAFLKREMIKNNTAVEIFAKKNLLSQTGLTTLESHPLRWRDWEVFKYCSN